MDIKSTRAARALMAGVVAFGVVGGAAAMSVSSAAAQVIFYPPPDVAGSVSDRVRSIYRDQFAPVPGYYGGAAMQPYGAPIPLGYGIMTPSP